MHPKRGLHQVHRHPAVRVAEHRHHVRRGLMQDLRQRMYAALHRVVPLPELVQRYLLRDVGYRVPPRLLEVEARVLLVLQPQLLPPLRWRVHRWSVGACEP